MAQIKSEPLTYSKDGRESFFKDLVLSHQQFGADRKAAERLQRHAKEMEVVTKERATRAQRRLDSSEIEYRVEPNRTDGYGGYFGVPLWLEQLFATARRPGRVLANLIPNRFELPLGISSVNVPILGTGTTAQPVVDTTAVPGADITDTAGSSTVVTIAGQVDTSLPMIEQSAVGATFDWAILEDLTASSDASLEGQLLYGLGSASSQLVGVTTFGTAVTYTDASPTGSEMWPYFGQAAAQLGDARLRPPEVWLMRTARWSWLQTAEDLQSRPFGLSSPFFMGSDEATPDPVGGLISWPAFLDDSLSATLGASANQDHVVCLRPSDMIYLEGPPQTAVLREVLSGSLGVRIQLHTRVAAITNRYSTGVYVVGGSGFAVASGY